MRPGTPLHGRARARQLRPLLALTILCAAALPAMAAAQAATTLGAAAARSGRYFGATLAGGWLGNATYAAIAGREFTMATPESELTPATTEPSQGRFEFTAGDTVVNWARQRGMKVRGRTLAWHAHQPSWMAMLSGAALRSAMVNHIRQVAGHYKGGIAYWDVVQEAFNEDGSRRASNLQQTGDDWIEMAFKAARSADPNARLCYGDYNLEQASYPKTVAVLRMVQDFKSRGVPIDCVGLQGRFLGGSSVPANLPYTLQRFADMGVEVAFTETAVTDASATQYAALTRACMGVPKCVGITVWGVMDLGDWAAGGTALFDSSGKKKPAYTAVLNELDAAAPGTTYTVTVARAGDGTVTGGAGLDRSIDCGETCSATYPSGTTVSLFATPRDGWVWTGWNGACAGSSTSCVLSMTADRAVGASFRPVSTFPLTLYISGRGAVSGDVLEVACTSLSCTFNVGEGVQVVLQPQPAEGAVFAGWGGACAGTGACVVQMSGEQAVTAYFTDSPPPTPCANPVTFTTHTGSFGTTGAACYRTRSTIHGWGCSSFAGRTVSVNGGAASRSCGAGPFPLAQEADGYTYFSVTAGLCPWAALYAW